MPTLEVDSADEPESPIDVVSLVSCPDSSLRSISSCFETGLDKPRFRNSWAVRAGVLWQTAMSVARLDADLPRGPCERGDEGVDGPPLV